MHSSAFAGAKRVMRAIWLGGGRWLAVMAWFAFWMVDGVSSVAGEVLVYRIDGTIFRCWIVGRLCGFMYQMRPSGSVVGCGGVCGTCTAKIYSIQACTAVHFIGIERFQRRMKIMIRIINKDT